MRSFLLACAIVCLNLSLSQSSAFIYALWDLNLEAAEQALVHEWRPSYLTWAAHRLAFFKALFPLHDTEKKDFWTFSGVCERQFAAQRTPAVFPLKADLYGTRAIYAAWERQWLQAGLAVWQSWRYLHRSPKQTPLAWEWAGLWQVALATLPASYQKWLRFRPEFLWENALANLRQAALPPSPLAWEASLLYFLLLRNMDTLAGRWLDTCRQTLFPTQTPPFLWRFAIGVYEFEQGSLSRAESIFLSLGRLPQASRFPYPWYWLGKVYLYQGKASAAQQAWQTFVQLQRSSSGLAAQYAWRGYLAWVEGDSVAAQTLWKAALSYESPWEEDAIAQRLAAQWLRSPPTPEEERLWTARWLLHQGAWQAAYDTLEPLRQRLYALTPDQRTALYYTYGRLYHRWNREEAARFAYFQCLQQAAGTNRWMQAYAALYLGQLYEKLADWHNARRYYQQAEALGEASHRTGVIQKARAGYLRLQNRRYPVPPSGK
ncbi:MAG: hypothetical protein ABDH91_06585 [Bacteroidia bacterium]